MQRSSLPVSSHYCGEKGATYQASKDFGGAEFYRRYHAVLYFRDHVSPHDTVLDLGCNDGLFLCALPAARRIGVEVNRSAREACERRCRESGISIELFEDIVQVEDEVADVIISNHCLEHTLTPYEILKHLYRILKWDAKLVLVLPFDDWRSAAHRSWRPGNTDNHLFTWCPMNIGNLLTEVGFDVEKSQHTRYALTNRLKPVFDMFGDRAFLIAAHLLSRYRHRSETYTIAFKR